MTKILIHYNEVRLFFCNKYYCRLDNRACIFFISSSSFSSSFSSCCCLGKLPVIDPMSAKVISVISITTLSISSSTASSSTFNTSSIWSSIISCTSPCFCISIDIFCMVDCNSGSLTNRPMMWLTVADCFNAFVILIVACCSFICNTTEFICVFTPYKCAICFSCCTTDLAIIRIAANRCLSPFTFFASFFISACIFFLFASALRIWRSV
mmetsp:Transcript_36852/g.60687  ORF Transcript_36852/g.60687 Transcript_36852/m.60687 type:complete len:210 (+) Transcript_36852:83-712(+)